MSNPKTRVGFAVANLRSEWSWTTDGRCRMSFETLGELRLRTGQPILIQFIQSYHHRGEERFFLCTAFSEVRGLQVRTGEEGWKDVLGLDTQVEIPKHLVRGELLGIPAAAAAASSPSPSSMFQEMHFSGSEVPAEGGEPFPVTLFSLDDPRIGITDALEVRMRPSSVSSNLPSLQSIKRQLFHRYITEGSLVRMSSGTSPGETMGGREDPPSYLLPPAMHNTDEEGSCVLFQITGIIGNRPTPGKSMIAKVTAITRVILEEEEGVEEGMSKRKGRDKRSISDLDSRTSSSSSSSPGLPVPMRLDLEHPAVKEILDLLDLNQTHRRAKFDQLGLQPPAGLLLHGPSGVGKTWAVRRAVEIANTLHRQGLTHDRKKKRMKKKKNDEECPPMDDRVSLLEVSALDILVGNRTLIRSDPGNDGRKDLPESSKSSSSESESPSLAEDAVAVGESEARLRKLFQTARELSSRGAVAGGGGGEEEEEEEGLVVCLVIDHIELICPRRSSASSSAESRIVATLLTELDGVKQTPQQKVKAEKQNPSSLRPSAAEDRRRKWMRRRGKREKKGRREARLVVIGITREPDALDPALRRPGRLDREFRLSGPPEDARASILQKLCHGDRVQLHRRVRLRDVARSCVGYLPSDLRLLVGMAIRNALEEFRRDSTRRMDAAMEKKKKEEEVDDGEDGEDGWRPVLEMHHFTEALNSLVAGSYRQENMNWLKEETLKEKQEQKKKDTMMDDDEDVTASVTVPPPPPPPPTAAGVGLPVDVSLLGGEDLGGLESVQQRFLRAVVWPAVYPERFLRLGVTPPRGILLYGPPGCGKTSLVRGMAQALAKVSSAPSPTRHGSGREGPPRCSFFTLDGGAALFSAQVGESERRIRDLFHLARSNLPAVIFLDEIDGLTGNRGSPVVGGTDHTERANGRRDRDAGDEAMVSDDDDNYGDDDGREDGISRAEFDSDDSSRSGSSGVGGGVDGSSPTSVEARILSTLLNEMDGLQRYRVADSAWHRYVEQRQEKEEEEEVKDGEGGEGRKGWDPHPDPARLELSGRLLLVASTNRPEALDSALLRPGRFDECIYVPPPGLLGRREVFRVHTRRMPLSRDVDFAELASLTELYTGADIQNVCREAALIRLRSAVHDSRARDGPGDNTAFPFSEEEGKEGGEEDHVDVPTMMVVTMQDFRDALGRVGPSLNRKILERYDRMAKHGFFGR